MSFLLSKNRSQSFHPTQTRVLEKLQATSRLGWFVWLGWTLHIFILHICGAKRKRERTRQRSGWIICFGVVLSWFLLYSSLLSRHIFIFIIHCNQYSTLFYVLFFVNLNVTRNKYNFNKYACRCPVSHLNVQSHPFLSIYDK